MSEAFPIDALEYLKENIGAIGPELQLALWALLGCLIMDLLLPKENKRWVSYVALAGIALSGIQLYLLYAGDVTGTAFGGMVVVDSFSMFFKMLFLLAAAVTVIISIKFLDIEDEQYGEYYALILFATIGMMVMASGVDLLTIYIGLELMAISIYVLVGFFRNSPRSNEAAIKLFLLGAFSSGILLYGISLLYGLTGATNLQEIADALAGSTANQGLLTMAVILLIAGIGFKIAVVPFHMWAPDAYQGAPTAITAFLSVGSKAAAFAILLRIFITSLERSRADYALILSILAILTLTVGNLAALIQTNVKRLLAYSSISHAGYILMGLIAGPEHNGVAAASLYIFVYAFMNFGAFTVIILLRRKNIPGEQIKDFNGLIFTNPGIAIIMTVFMLSLAGIPPTAGFIGKYMVFAAIIDAYVKTQSALLLTLAITAALAAVVGLYYYWSIVRAMFTSESETTVPLSFSPGIVAALVLTLGVTLWVGLYPNPIVNLANFAALPLK